MAPISDQSLPSVVGSDSENHERGVRRLLLAGFVLMIVLLVADAAVGLRSLVEMRESLSRLARDQFLNVALIDELQHAQALMGSVIYRLSPQTSSSERRQLERQVTGIQNNFRDVFARIPANDPDVQVWHEIERVSAAMTTEADRILSLPSGTNPDLSSMLDLRDRFMAVTSQLINSGHAQGEETIQQIQKTTSQQLIGDVALLLACVILSCLSAVLVIRFASKLHRLMTAQGQELTRVSWQLLEKQESLARRLSHELHDELGQTLTALKTNFSRHAASCGDPAWSGDCTQLLKESIRSAHEISQLLRPTILDDFGLDSALGWLCERFEERNGIQVSYRSSFQGRLDEQTETHLFRIAQEALTNIARHSGASLVTIRLSEAANAVKLRIADNGVGMETLPDASVPSFGLTGMKARARSLHGEVEIRSNPGGGTLIDVSFPRREKVNANENPHLVS